MYYKTAPWKGTIPIKSCSRMMKQYFQWISWILQCIASLAQPTHTASSVWHFVQICAGIFHGYSFPVQSSQGGKYSPLCSFDHKHDQVSQSWTEQPRVVCKDTYSFSNETPKLWIKCSAPRRSSSVLIWDWGWDLRLRTEPEVVLPTVQHRRDFTVCAMVPSEVVQSNYYPEHSQKKL